MHSHTIKRRTDFLMIGAILLLLVIHPALQKSSASSPISQIQAVVWSPVALGPFVAFATAQPEPANTPLTRVAQRLSRRLKQRNMPSLPLVTLVAALEEQRALLHKRTTVSLSLPDSEDVKAWEANLQRYPQWIQAMITPTDAHFLLSPAAIARTLNTEDIPGIIRPVNVSLQTLITDKKDVLRAGTDGVAHTGITFDVPKAVTAIYDALLRDTGELMIPLREENGTIENTSGIDLGALTLLGTGTSDFAGSPTGRIRNIRKALNEHVNNVLVAPGETFSFNDTLGGPVTMSNGWYESKVIFEGVNLRMAPGGGICQASTTVFRAMLNTGLQEVERANHSLYVSYYEKGGVGIDATVYPGQQDLTFVNDTGNYLLLQAYEKGTEATVNIYGTPDGRSVTMHGPYFSSSDLSDFPEETRQPRSNEIAWIQQRTFANSKTEERVIFSRYLTGLPKLLAAKYNALHASAVGSGSTLISER